MRNSAVMNASVLGGAAARRDHATRWADARWAVLGPALLVGLGTLALDVRTLLPGVGFWDTAEFQAIGPVLGIAHPTGFPSYTLLAWFASVVLQPFGDPAYRANLLSALLAAFATGATPAAVVLLTRRPLLGVTAGVALAAAPIAWAIGLRADAHALHFALVGLLLVLLVAWREREIRSDPAAGRLLVAAALVFGVSLGNHALTLLLAPGIALFVLATRPLLPLRRPRLVLACVAGLCLTVVALYAYLPLRSSMNPPLDYGNPDNWERFRYLVFGEQFRGTFHDLPSPTALLRNATGLLFQQLGPLALLALVGMVASLVRRPAFGLLSLAWFSATFVFAAGYLNADITRYYLVPLIVSCCWVALGAEALWLVAGAVWRRVAGALGQRGVPIRAAGPAARAAGLAAAAALLLAPSLLSVPRNFPALDSSGERYQAEWLALALQKLPRDAVVVSWWSFSTPLWYAQFVEHRRPDLAIFDDRTIVDEGLGDVSAVVDRFRATRPVFIIRLPDDIAPLARRYRLSLLPGMPAWGPVWQVDPPA